MIITISGAAISRRTLYNTRNTANSRFQSLREGLHLFSKTVRKWFHDRRAGANLPARVLPRLRELTLFTRFYIRNFIQDGCQERAGSLTYLSLFAVVPLLTLTYSMLSLVPAFRDLAAQIQDLIFEYFLPTTGEEIKSSLALFSRQARNLTVWGIIFLAVTAYMLLRNIEQTFNSIWHTRANRSGMANFMLYWSILSLGPLLLGVGFIITTYLTSLALFVEEADSTGISRQLLRIAPFLLEAATFTLLFAAVPNTRVPLKHAALGGVITAIAFLAAKKSFTLIMGQTSLTSIYGAFAAMPLFLLWIYLSWLIILGGAELVHALGSYEPQNTRSHHPLIVSVGLLELFQRRHQQGLTVTDRDIMSSRWLLGRQRLSPRQWQRLKSELLAAGLIRVTDHNQYVLGKDLHHLELWDLAENISGAWRPLRRTIRPSEHKGGSRQFPPWYDNTRSLLSGVNVEMHEAMRIPVAQLINADHEIPCDQPLS